MSLGLNLNAQAMMGLCHRMCAVAPPAPALYPPPPLVTGAAAGIRQRRKIVLEMLRRQSVGATSCCYFLDSLFFITLRSTRVLVLGAQEFYGLSPLELPLTQTPCAPSTRGRGEVSIGSRVNSWEGPRSSPEGSPYVDHLIFSRSLRAAPP